MKSSKNLKTNTMKSSVPIALDWWASLKPSQTQAIMDKHFVKGVKSLHLSNQQIKRLYEKEVLNKDKKT